MSNSIPWRSRNYWTQTCQQNDISRAYRLILLNSTKKPFRVGGAVSSKSWSGLFPWCLCIFSTLLAPHCLRSGTQDPPAIMTYKAHGEGSPSDQNPLLQGALPSWSHACCRCDEHAWQPRMVSGSSLAKQLGLCLRCSPSLLLQAHQLQALWVPEFLQIPPLLCTTIWTFPSLTSLLPCFWHLTHG